MEQIAIKTVKANKEHKCDWCELAIKKNQMYCNQKLVNEGRIYSWKNHIHCSQVADEIGMWDNGDGLSTDDFQEGVKTKYQNVMSENFNDIYESKHFKYPNFETQLNFLLDFYKINLT